MKKTTKSVAKVAKNVTPVETPIVETPIRKISLFPIVALILIIAAVYAYYRFGIVATVNGKPISRISYWQNLERLDKKQTIKQMTNEALVYQEAAKKNISITKEEITSEIASVEAQIKSQGQTLDAALTAEGMTKTDLEHQIRLQKMVEKLANPQIDVTQAQIDDYLTKNKSLLPSTYTKEKLQALAKAQLISEAKNDAIDSWFATLLSKSKVVIR